MASLGFRSSAEFSDVVSLSQALAAVQNEREMLVLFYQYTRQLLGVERVSIAVPSISGPTLDVYSIEGKGILFPTGSKVLAIGTALGTTIARKQIVSTFYEPLETYGDWRHLATIGLCEFIIVPLLLDGEVMGTFNIGAGAGHQFRASDIELAQQLAHVLMERLQAHGSAILKPREV